MKIMQLNIKIKTTKQIPQMHRLKSTFIEIFSSGKIFLKLLILMIYRIYFFSEFCLLSCDGYYVTRPQDEFLYFEQIFLIPSNMAASASQYCNTTEEC